MRILRAGELDGATAWDADHIATIDGATVKLHWTDQPYAWHVNDGEELFVVLDGAVDHEAALGADAVVEQLLEQVHHLYAQGFAGGAPVIRMKGVAVHSLEFDGHSIDQECRTAPFDATETDFLRQHLGDVAFVVHFAGQHLDIVIAAQNELVGFSPLTAFDSAVFFLEVSDQLVPKLVETR